MHTTELYFEAHVTIDPVDEERDGELREIALKHRFRVAELLMKKSLKKSELDDFMTGRSDSYDNIHDRTMSLVYHLTEAGYNVRRYKIENTLLDVRL